MAHSKTNGSCSDVGTALAGKYLTFKLGREEYALEILKVREIIGLLEITRAPKTSDVIRGVINLRGKVTPVLDLRLKFGKADKRVIFLLDIGKALTTDEAARIQGNAA